MLLPYHPQLAIIAALLPVFSCVVLPYGAIAYSLKVESELMWKWINSFAKPEKAYWLCDVLQNWFAAVAITSLIIGIIGG